MKSQLSCFELSTYFVVWTFANVFSLYKLFIAQSEIYGNTYDLLHSLGELRPGWRFISRLQDVSDVEWSSWKFFFRTAWFYLLVQFTVSEIIRSIKMPLLKYWYIASSALFLSMYMGFKQLIVICAQPVIFTTLLFFSPKKSVVWITSILLLLSYNSLKYKFFFWYFLDRNDLQDEEVYLLLFTLAWITLRCISFSIDYIDIKCKTKNENSIMETAVNLFSYVLYIPLLYIGPIILYEDFAKSFTTPCERLGVRLRKFTVNMILFLLYSFLLDYAFHYIYFLAMQSDIMAVRSLPTLALCGGGLWMGLEFHIKYVISYGTTTSFARLDNIDTPPTPRCIARIHVYSHMWRYFDVGLYKFLVKYIYVPFFAVITTHLKVYRTIAKLMASFTTFSFIFMWHGTIWNIFIWSSLNFMGITLEQLGRVISESPQYMLFKEKILKTDAMETRFVALVCTPLLIVSAISNFYLFGNSKIGNIYFECFTNPSLFNSMLVTLAMYSCCQVSIALRDVSSRTDVKKKVEEKSS